MSRFISFIVISLFILPLSLLAADKGTEFNGTWNINKDKSNLPAEQMYMNKIKIDINNDSLHTTRTYYNNWEEYPFDESVKIGGPEVKHYIYDMPRTAKAYWANDNFLTIESTTTFYGDNGEFNFINTETWSIDDDNDLAISFKNNSPRGDSTGTWYYQKSQ